MPWKKLYESCVSESNPDKLKKLVTKLEEAIVLRYHDLARKPNISNNFQESDELQSIRRVAQQLCQLKVEKLGWPSPAMAGGPAILASLPISVPARMQTALSAAAPAAMDRLKAPAQRKAPRRTIASRIQSALRITQRAWENWVFKSLK